MRTAEAPRPRLSVAVCTHAGADRIAPALESIEAQTDAPDEILVVDNAPPDPSTRRLVGSRFPEVRYTVQAAPGLDIARNSALATASGDVVAFLDDDAVADAAWAGRIREAFASNPKLLVCTSRVTALRLDTEGARLFEANGGLDRGPHPALLPGDARAGVQGRRGSLVAWATRIGVGCGMGVRRRETLELGGFDPALDLGAALPGGGDVDLVWRALQCGWEVAYLADARVRHDHRRDVEAAVSQIAGHQRALVAMLTKVVRESRGAHRRSALAFLGWRLGKPGVRIVRRLMGADPLPVAAIVRLWGACWSGLFAYPQARRAAHDRLARSATPVAGEES